MASFLYLCFLPHKLAALLGHLSTDLFLDSNHSRKHGSWHSNVLDPEPHLTFDFLDKGNSKINGTQHTHIADIREYDAEYAKILLSKLPVVPTNQLGQNQPPGGGQGSATVAAWFPRPVLDIGLETPHVFMYDDMNPLLQRTPIQAY